MNSQNPQVYERMIDDMPVGLERVLLRILSSRQGKDFAIKKPVLVAQISRMGVKANERQVRKCISDLRKQGHLICASHAGKQGGYYIASSLSDVEEFTEGDLLPRITDMSETRKAMKTAAREQFGDAVQVGLF